MHSKACFPTYAKVSGNEGGRVPRHSTAQLSCQNQRWQSSQVSMASHKHEGKQKYQHFPYLYQPLTHSVSWPFHCWSASANKSIYSKSKPELKSIVTLPESPTITSMSTERLQALFLTLCGLSASSGYHSVIQPRTVVLLLHHLLLSTTAVISEEASPFEPLLLFSKNIAGSIMRLFGGGVYKDSGNDQHKWEEKLLSSACSACQWGIYTSEI